MGHSVEVSPSKDDLHMVVVEESPNQSRNVSVQGARQSAQAAPKQETEEVVIAV